MNASPAQGRAAIIDAEPRGDVRGSVAGPRRRPAAKEAADARQARGGGAPRDGAGRRARGGGDPLSRREVLWQSLGLAGLPPLCCTTPDVPPGDVRFEGALIVVDLERVPALRHVGSARAVVDGARGVNILVACTDQGRYAALDRTCTHGGAMCAYNHRRRTLQCTSVNHAEFDLHGTLLHGRTHGNLRAYDTTCRGSRLEIALGAER